MGIADRNYMRGNHPPYCTCVNCVNRRLSIRPRHKKTYHQRIHKAGHGKAYKKPNVYRSRRSVSWSWGFLLLLLYIGIGIIVYVTNRLLSHHINFIAGISIVAATALVIFYNASAIIKWYKRVRPRRIVTVSISLLLIGCVMLAYINVAPFSTVKDDIVSFIHNVNQGSGTSSNGSESTPTSTYTSGTTATPIITPTKTPTPTVQDNEASLASIRQQCVDKINQYRSTIGLPPLAHYSLGDSCADSEAYSDSQSGIAHGAFGSCGEWAQNECPGWPSLSSICNNCLQDMWNEGLGEPYSVHGHYINMANNAYTAVSVGFSKTSGSNIWAVFDFY